MSKQLDSPLRFFEKNAMQARQTLYQPKQATRDIFFKLPPPQVHSFSGNFGPFKILVDLVCQGFDEVRRQ